MAILLDGNDIEQINDCSMMQITISLTAFDFVFLKIRFKSIFNLLDVDIFGLELLLVVKFQKVYVLIWLDTKSIDGQSYFFSCIFVLSI